MENSTAIAISSIIAVVCLGAMGFLKIYSRRKKREILLRLEELYGPHYEKEEWKSL